MFRTFQTVSLEATFSEVRDYFSFTRSFSMRSLISSRTSLNTSRRSSSLPVAREGSPNDQCRRFFAPGKTGHASLAASQTVTT